MGRVGRSIELRSKHATTRAGFHHGRAITGAVRQADPPVVPLASALHQKCVNSVHSQGAHSLQNFGDGWRARTWITIVIGHIRIQAADARTMPLLNEDVATIAITADPRENHRDPLETEMPAGSNPRGVVVYPTNHRGAAQVDSSRDSFLETKPNPPDFGRRNTLPLQVLSQSQRFVSADILYIEALAVEVAGFDYVVIQERNPANPLAHQGRRDVRNKSPSADAQDAALGEQ